MPQLPQPAAARPLLSVVFPLLDERGLALACIRAWVEEKREVPLQIVLVSDGQRPTLERQVRELLGPSDAFLLQDGSEAAMYDRGCRSAAAELLLLTEPHCLPDAGAARRIVGFFEQRGVGAAWLESGHISRNRFARMEERLVEEDRQARPDQDDWRHVSLRGFALRKSVYVEAGGLSAELGRFAEAVLAVRIQRGGWKLHSVPGQLVRHGNCESYSELSAAIRAHGAAQAAYWDRCERGEVERFHAPHPDWAGRGRFDRSAAREMARIAWASLFLEVGRPGWAPRCADVLRALPALIASALFGPRAALWRARSGVAAARVRCLLARGNEERLYANYRRLWGALIRVGVLEQVLRIREPASSAGADGCSRAFGAGEVPDGSLAGFHHREDWGEESCRWSSPIALARIHVPAAGYRVRMRAHSPWPPEQRGLRLFWNGRSIAASGIAQTEDGLEFETPHGPSRREGAQTIGIVCRPYLPGRSGLPDPRRLGLLLFRTELTPVPAAAEAPAFSRAGGERGGPATLHPSA